MVRIALLLWALFFVILGFSMMPGTMTFVMIGCAIGGIIDATMKNKKKKKQKENERPNFRLYEWEKHF